MTNILFIKRSYFKKQRPSTIQLQNISRSSWKTVLGTLNNQHQISRQLFLYKETGQKVQWVHFKDFSEYIGWLALLREPFEGNSSSNRISAFGKVFQMLGRRSSHNQMFLGPVYPPGMSCDELQQWSTGWPFRICKKKNDGFPISVCKSQNLHCILRMG